MLAIKLLLPELKKLVTELAEDLLARSTERADVDTGLREAYAQIEKGGRTAAVFEVWREDYLDQVAVTWVLSCVFVRFMEDNHLIDECWLAGEGERRKQAEDAHELYFRQHPRESDREYFEHVFHEVGEIPACRDLFAEGKTPLWALGPSGDAAMKLLAFWRDVVPETGELRRSFEVEDGDTRFLGDLYQDLSERARKKYALLQTPVFVEEFILDRTLNPAIDEFGLDEVRMIDPTCGSGHFLLGGFARLFDLWSKPDHTTGNTEKDAQKALDGVWGVDINSFAVAIARFRLIVAALQACGIKRLKKAPGWNIHLATGDSLLFGSRWDRSGEKVKEQGWLATDEESWAPEIYACEDRQGIQHVLCQQYHVVVGNPPYIRPDDARLNDAYRERYPKVCYRQYSLAVPFAARLFDLCLSTEGSNCGYIGMITANSFMKREFGKKLIEEYFPTVDLTHVIDSSGAHIPGHGTPTVIVIGRNRIPSSDTVRGVLKIKDEPATPDDPANGLVWQSILRHIDRSGCQDEYTSSTDIARGTLAVHPWSIGGGGAADLKDLLESNCSETLSHSIDEIGFGAVTREDEAFLVSTEVGIRHGIPVEHLRPLVSGDDVRDWSISHPVVGLFPYDPTTLRVDRCKPLEKFLWLWKGQLSIRVAYGMTQLERGLQWFEYSMFFTNRFRSPLTISFASITTENHFVLDRGGKVFKQSAPIMKLKSESSEADHVALLGVLNSSTVCFWMKQVMTPKGGGGIGRGIQDEAWETRFDIGSTQLEKCPVPQERPGVLATRMMSLADEFHALLPRSLADSSSLVKQHGGTENDAAGIRRAMIALQEELDWHCYQLYSLVPDDLRYTGDDLPELTLGQRGFEIVMARQIATGELKTAWFERHGSTPTTEIPSHWPAAYRKLVERRIKVIETNKEIALIEKPEYKRRWNTESWEAQEQRALKNWLLDRLETPKYRKGTKDNPELTTTAQMADVASADTEFLQVAAIYRGRSDFDFAALVAELVEHESVPFLPILRYKPAGLRKREVWERTWDLQRQQDAGKDVGEIPVPPKYATADFLKTDFWRLRGKLDVPKERWISFPHCETESDPSMVVGWAGWDHLQQATAIVAYYDARKREGWTAERLKPLLAALDQLLPWIHQWHGEIDPEYNETAGASFQTLLESEAQELGLTLDDTRNWTPPKKTKKGRKK